MLYSEALREAGDMLGRSASWQDITVFRARVDDVSTHHASLTDVMLAAVALAYDESQTAIVERQRGGTGEPWTEIRRVTVSIQVTDPEVRS